MKQHQQRIQTICDLKSYLCTMAKGYSFYNEEDETYVPSRPTRKRDSMSRRPGYDYASTSNRVVESSRLEDGLKKRKS